MGKYHMLVQNPPHNYHGQWLVIYSSRIGRFLQGTRYETYYQFGRISSDKWTGRSIKQSHIE